MAWDRLEEDKKYNKFAYSGDKTGSVQQIAARGACNMVILKDEYFKSGLGIVLRKGSPYKNAFDKE